MMNRTALPKVYLAGDLVFRKNADELFATFKEICRELGLQGVSPFDGQEDSRRLLPGREKGLLIARLDRALMDGCDAGLFCIDPFRRAADMDPGTAVEIGYMTAQGKPLAAYTVDGRSYPEKVARYFRSAWDEEPAACEDGHGVRDADGFLIHSDELLQNAMVEGFIVQSGGSVSVAGEIVSAFRAAATELAAIWRLRHEREA